MHLGGAVDPAAMWGIAHAQGIRLPTKDYWEFVDLITVHPKRRKSFDDFLELYHWTEPLQTTPSPAEQAATAVIRGPDRQAPRAAEPEATGLLRAQYQNRLSDSSTPWSSRSNPDGAAAESLWSNEDEY